MNRQIKWFNRKWDWLNWKWNWSWWCCFCVYSACYFYMQKKHSCRWICALCDRVQCYRRRKNKQKVIAIHTSIYHCLAEKKSLSWNLSGKYFYCIYFNEFHLSLIVFFFMHLHFDMILFFLNEQIIVIPEILIILQKSYQHVNTALRLSVESWLTGKFNRI